MIKNVLPLLVVASLFTTQAQAQAIKIDQATRLSVLNAVRSDLEDSQAKLAGPIKILTIEKGSDDKVKSAYISVQASSRGEVYACEANLEADLNGVLKVTSSGCEL